jgi:hypothetical protein
MVKVTATGALVSAIKPADVAALPQSQFHCSVISSN